MRSRRNLSFLSAGNSKGNKKIFFSFCSSSGSRAKLSSVDASPHPAPSRLHIPRQPPTCKLQRGQKSIPSRRSDRAGIQADKDFTPGRARVVLLSKLVICKWFRRKGVLGIVFLQIILIGLPETLESPRHWPPRIPYLDPFVHLPLSPPAQKIFPSLAIEELSKNLWDLG